MKNLCLWHLAGLEYDVPVLLDFVDIKLDAALARLLAEDAGDDSEGLLAEEAVVLLQLRREVLRRTDLQDLEPVPLAPHEKPGRKYR